MQFLKKPFNYNTNSKLSKFKSVLESDLAVMQPRTSYGPQRINEFIKQKLHCGTGKGSLKCLYQFSNGA